MSLKAAAADSTWLARLLLAAQNGYSTHCFDDKHESLQLLSKTSRSDKADPTRSKATEKERSTLSLSKRCSLVYRKFRALTFLALVRWLVAHSVSATLGGMDNFLVGLRSLVEEVLYTLGYVKHAEEKLSADSTSSGSTSSFGEPRAAKTVDALPPKGPPRFFHDGWGNIDLVNTFYQSIEDAFHLSHDDLMAKAPTFSLDTDAREFTGVHARYASAQHEVFSLTRANLNTDELASLSGGESESLDVYELSFVSPVAPLLGSTAGDPSHQPLLNAHYILVWPRGYKLEPCFVLPEGDENESDGKRIAGMALLMPATGEQNAGERLRLARDYAQKGYATMITTAPFYGRGRRLPPMQTGANIRTVSGMLVQSIAISVESATVVNTFIRATQGSKMPLVISGFSWGSAMTVMTSACAVGFSPLVGDAAREYRRVGLLPYVGCSSPSTVVEGSLQKDIDWNMLEHQVNTGALPDLVSDILKDVLADREHPQGVKVPRLAVVEVARRVLRVLDSTTIEVKLHPLARHRLGALHSVVTADDGIVPLASGVVLHRDCVSLIMKDDEEDEEDMQSHVQPKEPDCRKRLTVIGGGHIAAFITKHEHLSKLIPELFSQLHRANSE